MTDFEFEDKEGNRFRIKQGAGPGFPHPENLCSGSSLKAETLLSGVRDNVIDTGYGVYFFDVLNGLPNRSPSPRIALSEALASNHLTLEKLGTALAINDDEPDPRSMLRVRIQNELNVIIEGEKREAAMHQQQLDKETFANKALIYLGGFSYGVYSSGKSLVLWLKEASDLVNPVVKMQHRFRAMQAAWVSDTPMQTYTETYLQGQKRELVEVLGFDPSAITQAQLDEAMAMASLLWDDPTLRSQLYKFIKDYACAQHSIELTEAIGAEALGIILTIILVTLTAGAALPAAGVNAVRKFKKLGELLIDYARAARKIATRKKGLKSKSNGPGKLDSVEVSVKKTDAHGAEDGKPSKRDKDGPPPPPKMKKHSVECFKAGKKIPSSKYPEYDKQVANQQKGLNDMTVQEYLDGREKFKEIGRGDGAAQRVARKDYAIERTRKEEKLLEEQGIIGEEAQAIAAERVKAEMSTLHALHNPDMIAGGKDAVTELGDGQVNQSIGSQWKNPKSESRVDAMDKAAKATLEKHGPDAKMNVDMHRCK